MALLIKNGEIVTASSRFVGDIWVESDTITRIDKNLDAPAGATVVDATGKLVFPGFVDPHTHIYLPFMGTYACDDYETASIAALCGGTTTINDLAIPGREDSPLDAHAAWQQQAEGKAACDYTWHMAVTAWNDKVADGLRALASEHGVTSVKVFLAYKGALEIGDEGLFETMRLAKELGILVGAHCENAEIISAYQKRLIAEGKTGPEWHEPSRPDWVEAEGTRHFCAMLEATGAHGYIVHLSNEQALRYALDAQLRGVNVWVETLANYLVLDKTWAERPNFEGARYVMSPPLRDKANQAPLWAALANGLVATVGTDHAPFNSEQKKMGLEDFTKIPNGIPSVEDRVRLMYTHGVATGRLDIHRFVDALSTKPAQLLGMFPRKGTLQPGSDADIVVYDPSFEGAFSAQSHHMNIDYSPLEGMPVKGRCAAVTVRGKLQVVDGEFVGERGFGRFVKRACVH